ncbi:MAG: hypothetical protein G01um101430_82 [Parcubacteria group bacterium Gr01-1014_30]|nr:MAG: hypothetical protein G01um101430_82 [Parcubacteria group bacterium Gr01-1014_30]
MLDYPTEQLWILYEKLPEELKEAIFSERTAESIHNICERNGLQEKTPQVAKYAGYVLLGLLSPDEFQQVLRKDLKLKDDETKQVAREIGRFVLFPVKSSLEALYGEKPAEKPVSKKTTAEKETVDIYREMIDGE